MKIENHENNSFFITDIYSDIVIFKNLGEIFHQIIIHDTESQQTLLRKDELDKILPTPYFPSYGFILNLETLVDLTNIKIR